MPPLKRFRSAGLLTDLINAYFSSIGIEGNARPRTPGNKHQKSAKNTLATVIEKNQETGRHDPPTLTGLALFLGFDSLEEFELYENTGHYGLHLKRARLIIIAAYEKKLHNSNASGAIFALRGMGWNKENTEENAAIKMPGTVEIKIIESGPPPAANEKQVDLTNCAQTNELK